MWFISPRPVGEFDGEGSIVAETDLEVLQELIHDILVEPVTVRSDQSPRYLVSIIMRSGVTINYHSGMSSASKPSPYSMSPRPPNSSLNTRPKSRLTSTPLPRGAPPRAELKSRESPYSRPPNSLRTFSRAESSRPSTRIGQRPLSSTEILDSAVSPQVQLHSAPLATKPVLKPPIISIGVKTDPTPRISFSLSAMRLETASIEAEPEPKQPSGLEQGHMPETSAAAESFLVATVANAPMILPERSENLVGNGSVVIEALNSADPEVISVLSENSETESAPPVPPASLFSVESERGQTGVMSASSSPVPSPPSSPFTSPSSGPMRLGLRRIGSSTMLDALTAFRIGPHALIDAVRNSRLDIVNVLLQSGHQKRGQEETLKHSPETGDADELSAALYAAATTGNLDIARALLEYGADPSLYFGHTRKTALMAAAQGNDLDMCLLLIDSGADLNIRQTDGRTALFIAASNGYTPVCELLVSKGADTNLCRHDHTTPLMVAALEGHTETYEALVVLGGGIKSTVESGALSLSLAAKQGNADVVELFVRSGADVNAHPGDSLTALMSAAEAGHSELCLKLCDLGAHVNDELPGGQSALTIAAGLGQADAVEVLLSHGADNPTHKLKALRTAAKQGHAAVLQALVDHGIDLNSTTDEGWTPLAIACAEGHIEACEVILPHVKIDQTPGDYNPLVLAVTNGHTELVAALLAAGWDESVKNSSGKSLIALATDAQHTEIADVLTRFEAFQAGKLRIKPENQEQ